MHAAVLVAAAMANVWSFNPAANAALASPAMSPAPAPLPITPAPLEPEEQAVVGLWTVDLAATWAGAASWRQAHPDANIDRAQFEALAATKAFQLRPDRRWMPLSAGGESTTWQFGRGALSAASVDAPSSYRACSMVGANLVEYDSSNQLFPIVYSRADLGPAVTASEVVGEWAVNAASTRAAGLPSRLNLQADGRAEFGSGSHSSSKVYSWRSDGDLIIVTPTPPSSGQSTLLRRTASGLVSVTSEPAPASIVFTRSSQSPAVANVPSAARGE